ncbi:di-heme oxidoredictase family protein [Methylocella sp.]|uniref:di-heme oxidoredictase family protein n=1 Tax=Methylocella sp. TaxID=1978226 RepID=UPI0037831D64
MRRAARLAPACALLIGLGGAGAGADSGLDLKIGAALFKRAWAPAPASTRADDGLGPLYDARSCASCHPGAGRAAARFDPDGTASGRGLVLVIARADGAPDPVYGRRLQIDAVPGLAPEGIVAVADTTLPDGRRARAPQARDLAYGPLDPQSRLSLRVAPDLRGRGALEAVSDAALLAVAAEQARAGGPVRGTARRVVLPDGRTVVGRYGWKAGEPDVAGQTAEAFSLDLGLSTRLRPEPWGDCTAREPACRAAPHGGRSPLSGGVEISDPIFSRVVAYVTSLPAPEGPARDPAGEKIFAQTGCAQCHRPRLPGADAALFTDALLHDMGEGLAGAPEPGASAAQWRTAPLAGLSDALSRETGLLHDGRARTLDEAVAWHGGEGAQSAARFSALTPAQRAALSAYLSKL